MTAGMSEELQALVEKRSVQRVKTRAYPEGWWFYAKKRFNLFPGTTEATAPQFLSHYYESQYHRMGKLRKALNHLTNAVFKAWLPRRARKVAKRLDKDDQWRMDALELSKAYFMDPIEVGKYGVENAQTLGDYMRAFERNAINKLLNPRHWGPDCLLFNKADFYLTAIAAGLPVPRTAAMLLNGQALILGPLKSGEVVIKPSLGVGGTGVEVRNLTPDQWRDAHSLQHWLEETSALSKTDDWIIQERCKTHPDMIPLAGDALPTVRISTMLNERGEPEIVTTVVRFSATKGSVVDNVTAGGAMAPVDLESGQVGLAKLGYLGPDLTHHPLSGVPIEGNYIPAWEECKRCALAAHQPYFGDYRLIGWDIGLTDRGPVIVEGNAKPCTVVAQRAPRRGIDGTRFGELIAYHLAQLA